MKVRLAENLRSLRGSLSQTDFSNKIGVKQTTYSNWELGKKEPDLKTIGRIAEFFKVSADQLLGFSNTPPAIQAHAPPPVTLSSQDVSELIRAHRIAMEKLAELCHAPKAGTPAVHVGTGGGRATKTA